jgi:lipoyl(octanoyl) transferase
VALNVAMDLRPFGGINPCGYASLATVDLATLGVQVELADVAWQLGQRLADHLTP